MSEISLYRKYRPHNFENLVGQDHIKTTIQNALKEDMLAHAYIFTGPRGTGKTSLARLIAKAVNCLDLKDCEPCNKCDICEDINTGRLIDFIEIDAASNRGIDEIRELRDKINFAPTKAKNKVYIIDEVHMLTKEAFNALLKTLEEPPANVYFMLATTEIHKVPETIISRCQRFDFKRIDRDTIQKRLVFIAGKEGFEFEEEALSIIANSVQGGLRDAIGLLEQMVFDGKIGTKYVQESLGVVGNVAVEQLYDFLNNGKRVDALELINKIHGDGFDLSQFTKEFIQFLREKMLDFVNKEENLEISKISGYIDAFQEAYLNLKNSVIPQLPLEMAVIRTSRSEVPTTESSDKEESGTENVKADEQNLSKAKVPQADSGTVAESSTDEKKAENSDNRSPSISLTFDSVKENWPRVLENIPTPAIKRSLAEGNLSNIDGNKVQISFGSNFHLEQLNNVQSKEEIFAAFEKVFQVNIELDFTLKKVDLKPDFGELSQNRDHQGLDAKEEEPPEKKSEDQTKDALDIFGGEVVN